MRYADSLYVFQLQTGLRKRFAHYGHDLPQMLARSQLRNHAAVFAMDVDLRRDDTGQDFASVGDDCRRGFVARGFDSENSRAHGSLQRTAPGGRPYNFKPFKYWRNSPPNSLFCKAISTVAFKNPSLSPAS